MQKKFTKSVCEQVLGPDPCWWSNYVNCCGKDMSHFYNIVGGPYKDALNKWAVKIMLELDQEQKLNPPPVQAPPEPEPEPEQNSESESSNSDSESN